MNAAQALHDLGQRLWLDNITRDLLDSGTLADYIARFAISGLTSNPTIFEHAIGGSAAYDEAIRILAEKTVSTEALFFELALDDLRRAADLFRPLFNATGGLDGWVSLEVSPLLAHDATRTAKAAVDLHARAARPNLFIKIPGTEEGLIAIEESILAGIPVNVTLLFSPEQCVEAAAAYQRGIERRIAAGLDPNVASVASLFVSRWDAATQGALPKALHNRLGIAVATQAYRSYARFLGAPRWQELAAAGARPQRLLWASTGTKDPAAPDTLYVEHLLAPDTINTLPEKTLLAFADHGKPGSPLALAGGDAEEVLAQCRAAGVAIDQLAAQLQREGEEAFAASWHKLLERLATKSADLGGSGGAGGSGAGPRATAAQP